MARGADTVFTVFLVAKLCLTLCDPWSVAHQAPQSMGISQARILEWAVISISKGSSACIACNGRQILCH